MAVCVGTKSHCHRLAKNGSAHHRLSFVHFDFWVAHKLQHQAEGAAGQGTGTHSILQTHCADRGLPCDGGTCWWDTGGAQLLPQPQRSCTWEKQSAECCGAPQAGAAEEEPCASGEKHPMSFPLETNENKQVEFSALREVRTTSAKREDTPMIRVEESNAPPKHSHGLTSSCEKGKCAIAATAQKNQPNNQTTTKKNPPKDREEKNTFERQEKCKGRTSRPAVGTGCCWGLHPLRAEHCAAQDSWAAVLRPSLRAPLIRGQGCFACSPLPCSVKHSS